MVKHLRAMNSSTKIRFGIAAALISVGCALMLAGVYAAVLFGFAVVLAMPRAELSAPIPRRELWAILGLTFAVVAVLLAAKYIIPSSAAAVVERAASHPAFVVPFWLFTMWGLFSQWHRQNGAANA